MNKNNITITDQQVHRLHIFVGGTFTFATMQLRLRRSLKYSTARLSTAVPHVHCTPCEQSTAFPSWITTELVPQPRFCFRIAQAIFAWPAGIHQLSLKFLRLTNDSLYSLTPSSASSTMWFGDVILYVPVAKDWSTRVSALGHHPTHNLYDTSCGWWAIYRCSQEGRTEEWKWMKSEMSAVLTAMKTEVEPQIDVFFIVQMRRIKLRMRFWQISSAPFKLLHIFPYMCNRWKKMDISAIKK